MKVLVVMEVDPDEVLSGAEDDMDVEDAIDSTLTFVRGIDVLSVMIDGLPATDEELGALIRHKLKD